MLRTETDNRIGLFASPFSEALPLRVVQGLLPRRGAQAASLHLRTGGRTGDTGRGTRERITENHAHRRAQGKTATWRRRFGSKTKALRRSV